MIRSAIPLILTVLQLGLIVPVLVLNPIQRTSIIGLTYPSYTVVGEQIAVSFNVEYSIGSFRELWLVTAIGCGPKESNCSFVSTNAVSSTPLDCKSATPLGNQTLVILQTCSLTITSSGSESFEYYISFIQPGTYHLTALSQLNVPSNTANIVGSGSVSQTMTVTVGSLSTATSTSTLSHSSTTEIQGTTTSSSYVRTRTSSTSSATAHTANPATNLDYTTLAYAVVIVAVIAAGTFYLLQKRTH